MPMKSKVYTKKKGKAHKEVNVIDVNFLHNSDWFRPMLGEKTVFIIDSFLL